MNKILLIISISILSPSAFSAQKINIQIDKNQVYELELANKKYFIIPADVNSKPVLSPWAGAGILPDKKNPIACDGSLLCYKCCTAHVSLNKEFCEDQYQNWNRGKMCGCD